MSRPAKFSLLQSLIRAAQDARLPDSQLESRLESHVSRRSFLKSAALVTGITAYDVLLPNISWSQRRSKPKVVIVGAGLAGLTAAYELRKKGIVADLYEANSRIGGRVMTTREQFGPGLYTEFGGEFIDTGHKEIFRLAQELNLSMIDVKPESDKHLTELLYFGGQHRTHEELVTAFKPAAATMFADAFEVETNGPRFDTLDWTPLERYIDSMQIESWLKDLLRVAFVIEYGIDASEQSACNMLSMIDTDMTDARLELYGESDERYRINGGNDQIAKGLARKIDNRIEQGHWLTAIHEKGGRYTLTFQKDRTTVNVSADVVILAIPFTTLRNVEMKLDLGKDKQTVIRELGYGRNSKMIFNSRKQGGKAIWETMGSNGALFTDLGIQSGWDSAPRQSDFDTTYTVYLGGSRANAVSSITEQSLNDLETIVPGFAQRYGGTTKTFAWHEYKYTLGSYSCYKPGQWKMQGMEGRQVKNLYFAGEHCSPDHQGFMEGAVETGVMAANGILLKVRR